MAIKHDTRELTKKQAADHKRSLTNSFKYAGMGIVQVWRSERSFRLQLGLFALTIITGSILRISGMEWVFILAAGHIKNISAGAVLVSSIIAAIIGIIIFAPYFLRYF